MTNVSSDEHDSACDYPGIQNYSVNRRLDKISRFFTNQPVIVRFQTVKFYFAP